MRESLHLAANQSKASRDHIENSKSRKILDEKCVQQIIECVKEWQTNPWNLQQNKLQTLQSGFLAPPILVADFEASHLDGENLIIEFFNKRIKSNESKLIDSTKLNNRDNFLNLPIETNEYSKTSKTYRM